MPVLTVVAGPNGSGKSTLTQALDFGGREHLLDPDAIARRISPDDPRNAAVAAGREILLRTTEYLQNGISFSIETTLASKRTLEAMRRAKLRGFVLQLVYICLDTPERSILRVHQRALQGGHDVADEDVRRHNRSLINLPEAIRIADQAILYDNSEDGHRKMLEARQGVTIWRVEKPPRWIRDALNALPSA